MKNLFTKELVKGIQEMARQSKYQQKQEAVATAIGLKGKVQKMILQNPGAGIPGTTKETQPLS